MSRGVRSLRFVLAGYGMPAEYALHELFGSGVEPDQILVITQASDSRNAGFVSLATLRGVPISTEPAGHQSVIELVREHRPDILMSTHYRSRIPGSVLGAARLGTINLHPSLLPRYRGTNSVAWAIINGETETGFSFHTMTSEFDTGRILLQERMKIERDDTAFSLFHRQITAAMPQLGRVLRMVAAGEVGVEQNGEASYYGRSIPYDGIINPSWDEEKIERFIRAMHFPPLEPARLIVDGTIHMITSMEAYKRVATR